MPKKIKLLYHSDFSLAKTGFGRAAKALLSHLYKTGKYDIIHYCCHTQDNHPQLGLTPWKSVGCVPSDEIVNRVANNHPEDQRESVRRQIYYGALKLDELVDQEKPDVYIGTQDIWGVDYSVGKEWFEKVNSVIWTTLDSLPLFPRAVELAPKIKNYWIWSSFATKEFHRKGFNHVKTVHGPIEEKFFFRKTDEERIKFRKQNNIDQDRFMIGFVFRNQLRKSVGQLIEGYKLFKSNNPNVKSGLLLHTHFSEPQGWQIPQFVNEFNVDPNEIYTTYICRQCKHYNVSKFIGEPVKCPKCGTDKAFFTTNLQCGITEDQLNNVYNAMDVYCHPFTSGGQEIPIQEAKFAELITLVTNYSCGEELSEEGTYSLPLEWTQYFEQNSQFNKASTKASSIAEKIEYVYKMPSEEKRNMERNARQWALANYTKDSIGKFFEDFLDNVPAVDWTPKEYVEKSPHAIIPEIKDDQLWVKTLYKEILKMEVDSNESGFINWMNQIRRGVSRREIEDFFRNAAIEANSKIGRKEMTFEDLLAKDDEGKRLLYVMPEGIGDVVLSLGLLKSIKEQYPNHNIYFATKPENFSVLQGNPYIFRAIPYFPIMDNLLFLEGYGPNKGYFDLAFLPFASTQRFLTYVHNGKTNIAFDLKSK